MKKNDLTVLTTHEIQQIFGGGVGGATAGFWLGKIITHAVVQGGIFVVAGAVSVVATPAVGLYVGSVMESTLAPVAEAASNVVGLGMGMAGAVATGPV